MSRPHALRPSTFLDRRTFLAGAAGGLALMPGHGALAADAPKVVKTMALLVRRPGQSHAEFMTHWLDIHGPLGAKVPGMRGLVFTEITGGTNKRTDIKVAADSIEIDGIAEVWRQQTPGAVSAATRAWFDDGSQFIGQSLSWKVDEHVFIRPRRGGKGLVSLLQRKPGVTHAQFVQHWLGIHGPMAAQVPEVAGLILNEPAGPPTTPKGVLPISGLGEIDGIAESWHKDGASVSSPEGKRWYADGADLIGMARGFYTQEHVIIDPV
jgi:hypothetical protein